MSHIIHGLNCFLWTQQLGSSASISWSELDSGAQSRRVAQSKFGIPNVIWRIYFENSGEFVGSHQPSPMSHSDIIDSKPVSFTVEINWLSGFASELVKRCEHMIYQIGCWMASKRAFFFSEANTYFWPVNSSYLDLYTITYPIHILYISYTYPPTSFKFYNPSWHQGQGVSPKRVS